jgi:16S rRNA (adenine1518-N6/adenine1519-N6)-dimethyltransferase
MTKKSYHKSKIKYGKGPVKAKKYLGQHFLKDENIAQKIAGTLSYKDYEHVLEIGPGTGVLTKYLIAHPIHLAAMDLDEESIDYLIQQYDPINTPATSKLQSLKFIKADIIQFNLHNLF